MIIGADSTGMEQANPFWTFSTALYGQPGVAEACLELQDRLDLDVNVLLFACFAAASGVTLTAGDLATLESAAATWRREMISPLQKLRRAAADELHERLLEAELLAERHQQDLMWQARPSAAGWLGTVAAAPGLLAENLAQVADRAGAPRASLDSIKALVESLLPGLVAQE
jgi:uncharacterized protein (TIGR02444 family)